jgi:hypothetical protein
MFGLKEGNATWKGYAIPPKIADGWVERPTGAHAYEAEVRKRWPRLRGRDYQALQFWHHPHPYVEPDKGVIAYGVEEGFWILVDKNTGEILLATY